MRVVITGATGTIGMALSSALHARGDSVVALSRDADRGRAVLGANAEVLAWPDPLGTSAPADALRGADAVVHLLGEHEELSCGRLEVSVSKSTLTHHLRVLRDAGLTITRTEGVQRLVSLRREDVETRFPGLLDCVLAHSTRKIRITAGL